MSTQNEKAKQLFDEQFKFKLNQEVRHKGDSKEGYSSDMGLLIISRFLMEDYDDDGNYSYTRNYMCRMIRFAGSGDRNHFKESELITMEEYNKKKVEDEEERAYHRAEIKRMRKQVYDSFGVTTDTEVTLVSDPDKTNIYSVTGYERNEEGTFISLTLNAGEGKGLKSVKVSSKSEFEIIKPKD